MQACGINAALSFASDFRLDEGRGAIKVANIEVISTGLNCAEAPPGAVTIQRVAVANEAH
jgi:hypothetical protein